MNKKILYSIIAVVIVLLGIFFFTRPSTVEAMESYFDRYVTSSATTTPTYMSPGVASTTLTVRTDNIDKLDIFIQTTASTSASVLNWRYQYSNNAVDWYDYSASTQTSNVLVTVGSTTIFSYQSGSITASTTRLVATFPDFASVWKRVVFTVPVGSTNSSIYAEANAKRNTQ